MEADCKERWISMPRYLRDLATGMCEGSADGFKAELRGIKWDLDQLIFYPEKEMNWTKTSKMWESAALVIMWSTLYIPPEIPLLQHSWKVGYVAVSLDQSRPQSTALWLIAQLSLKTEQSAEPTLLCWHFEIESLRTRWEPSLYFTATSKLQQLTLSFSCLLNVLFIVRKVICELISSFSRVWSEMFTCRGSVFCFF